MKKAEMSGLWVGLLGGLAIAVITGFAIWLQTTGVGGTGNEVASSPTAAEKHTALAHDRSAQSWSAAHLVQQRQAKLHAVLNSPAAQRIPAASTVAARYSDGTCPSTATSSAVTTPGVDQVTFAAAQNTGPSLTMDTGTATASCGFLASLPRSSNNMWVELGSGVALCLKNATSTSGAQACDGPGDQIMSASGNYSLTSTLTLVSLMDTTSFLKQWNACPGCNLQGAELSGITLSPGANLANANLSGADLYNSALPQANLSGAQLNSADGSPTELAMTEIQNANFTNTILTDPGFYQTDFSGSSFNCPQFVNTYFASVNLDNTNWAGNCANPQFSGVVMNADALPVSTWPNLYFNQSSLYVDKGSAAFAANQTLSKTRFVDSQFIGLPPAMNSTNFTGADLDQSSFFLSNLTGANFSGSTSLSDTDFTNTTLQQANFNNAQVLANFQNANLENSTFQAATLSQNENHASFANSVLAGANFQNTNGTGVDWSDSYLWAGNANPDFDGATLRQANFDGALIGQATFNDQTDLTSADFTSAQCIGCDFTDAKLYQATFINSYIYGSIFAGSTMQGANLTNAACCGAGTWNFSGTPTDAGAPSINYQDDPNYPMLSGNEFDNVAACPNGQSGQSNTGCKGEDTPNNPPSPNPACQSAGNFRCPDNINLLAGNGVQGYDPGGPGDQALNAELNNPSRVLLDQSQPRVFVADTGNHLVRVIDNISAQEPTIANYAGTGTAGDSGDGGNALSAQLNSPQGMAQSPAISQANGQSTPRSLAVADSGNNNVRLIDPDSGDISLYAGNGTACAQPAGSCGDGQVASNAQLNAPQGVWFDPLGNLYIADAGDAKIRMVDSQYHVISTIAGNGAQGSTRPQLQGTCTNGTPATSFAMQSPVDVTGDTLGNLYVVDQGAQAVYKIDPYGCLTTFADSTKGLTSPASVAIDQQGVIYVANTGGNTVVTFSAWGIAQPLIGTGTPGYSGDGGLASQAELNGPQGLNVSDGGVLYIADTANQRIRVAQPPQ